jgi:hypothetical protein
LAEAASTKSDVTDLFSPAAVLLAALIAGLVAWWNARTSPQGRLQTLIGIYRNWPDEKLDGRDTVECSIAITLARIRHMDGIPAPADPNAKQQLGEDRVKSERRGHMWRIAVAILALAAWLVYTFSSHLPPQLAAGVAVVLTGIIVGLIDAFFRNYPSVHLLTRSQSAPGPQ